MTGCKISVGLTFPISRSDWALHQTETKPVTDCECEEAGVETDQGQFEVFSGWRTSSGSCSGSPAESSRCECCQHTPSTTGTNRGMKKYQAVIRLNNSSNTSYSDMSTLNLTNLDESRPELDLTYSGQSVNTYYTLDSRRLASRHQKNQQERWECIS